MGDFNYKTCENCDQPATYRRACGHFYCERCPDLCDPITHRFAPITNSWVPCEEEEGEVYNVTVTVEGDDREVEVVTAAIDQMMREKFLAFKAKVVNERL